MELVGQQLRVLDSGAERQSLQVSQCEATGLKGVRVLDFRQQMLASGQGLRSSHALLAAGFLYPAGGIHGQETRPGRMGEGTPSVSSVDLSCGLNCVPLRRHFQILTPVPVNLTLFGKRVFVISS